MRRIEDFQRRKVAFGQAVHPIDQFIAQGDDRLPVGSRREEIAHRILRCRGIKQGGCSPSPGAVHAGEQHVVAGHLHLVRRPQCGSAGRAAAFEFVDVLQSRVVRIFGQHVQAPLHPVESREERWLHAHPLALQAPGKGGDVVPMFGHDHIPDPADRLSAVTRRFEQVSGQCLAEYRPRVGLFILQVGVQQIVD